MKKESMVNTFDMVIDDLQELRKESIEIKEELESAYERIEDLERDFDNQFDELEEAIDDRICADRYAEELEDKLDLINPIEMDTIYEVSKQKFIFDNWDNIELEDIENILKTKNILF